MNQSTGGIYDKRNETLTVTFSTHYDMRIVQLGHDYQKSLLLHETAIRSSIQSHMFKMSIKATDQFSLPIVEHSIIVNMFTTLLDTSAIPALMHTLSIYLSSNTAYALASILAGSVRHVVKRKSKSTTVSLCRGDSLKI